MVTIEDLVLEAKRHYEVSCWPFGESYYKAIIAFYNPETKRTTFTIHYNKSTKKQVEEYLKYL